MPCEPIDFVDGATIKNATILNSEITNSHLTSPSVSGGITADATTLEQLADDIAQYLPAPALDANAVAAVFNDCTNNNPLTPGQQLATCAELQAEVDKAKFEIEMAFEMFKATVSNLIKAETILAKLQSCEGLPLTPGTKVATCSEMDHAIADATEPSKIAGVFNNREGNPMSPGTEILSKLEVEEFVDNALAGVSGGGVISSISWNSATLAITETLSDGGTNTKFANFGDFLRASSAVNTPPVNTTTGNLPLQVFGSRDALLGKPTMFLPLSIFGVDYALPLYQL
jgi:hypothetical protein